MKQRRVVRAIGSGTCHTIEVDDDTDLMDFEMFGSKGRALAAWGVVVDCGASFPPYKTMVVMEKTGDVCPRCRRLTGVVGVWDGELVHA